MKIPEKDAEAARSEEKENRFLIYLDAGLILATAAGLVSSFVVSGITVDIILATLSFFGLLPVAISALKSLYQKRLTIDLLATVALIFSLLSQEWFSAAFITLMLAFARVFDHWTEARTKRIISHLLKYRPQEVLVLRGENVVPMKLEQVKIGDEVLVEAGERVPVDGIVIKGEAAMDQSSLTGESELVPKKIGDQVFTSTLNESGSLVIRAEKVGTDTSLARIISLIEEASRKRNRSERIADKFTQWYIFITFAGSAAMFLFGVPLKMILSVLLVVCADDIAVAVPLSYTAAIASAARRGVLIKGSDAIEKLAKLRYFITDKTGTLTLGRPKVILIKGFGNFSEDEVLKRLAIGASSSNHNVSRAVVDEAKKRGISATHSPDEANELPGYGMEYLHDGDKMISGRLEFLEKKGVKITEAEHGVIAAEREAGRGVTLLSVNGLLAGFLSYVDELKPSAKPAIADTKTLGVKEWHMLTGDNERVAKAVSDELGIKDFHANLTPEGKVAFIEKFKKQKDGVVGMIGDGVNDAASLAIADVSIAMGKIGADAAIEAADISIMRDDLRRIPEAMRLSKQTLRVIKQIFVTWAVTNGVGLVLVFGGVLGPAGAATYNFLTDFIPIANSFRLLRIKDKKVSR